MGDAIHVPQRGGDHAPGDVIVLRGHLVRAPAGRIRLVLGELCLELSVGDVVAASELPATLDGRGACGAIFAELRLRAGAALLAVHDLAALQTAASVGALPFAVAARPGRLIVPPSPAYAAAEASYLRRHRLTTDDPDPRAA